MKLSRDLIVELYLNKKYSSDKIADVLGCSSHKVNYWIKKWGIPKRSISEAVYAMYNPDGDPFQIKKIETIEDAKLWGLGMGLYWGEGNKRNKNSIRLGNTDPRLINKFIDFLIDILGADSQKLRFGLQIFTDIDPTQALTFWLNELRKFGITKEQFFKVTVTPSNSIGTYREKSRWGVLTVHFSNIKLKQIIDSMLPT